MYLYHDLCLKEKTVVVFRNQEALTSFRPISITLHDHKQCQNENISEKPTVLHSYSEVNPCEFNQNLKKTGDVGAFTFICHFLLIFLNINLMELFLRNLLIPRVPCENSVPFHLNPSEKVLNIFMAFHSIFFTIFIYLIRE